MSDQPCDDYIKELEEEILTLKSEIDKLEDNIEELNDEINELNDEISDLEYELNTKEEIDESDLVNKRLNVGNTLWDEYKIQFFAEYHTLYSPWELEIILKDGHKLLKS